MPPQSSALSRRRVLGLCVLVALAAAMAGCGVPTEPRWDRADSGTDHTIPVTFDTTQASTYRIEAAPVTAASTIQARVLPATESVVLAPAPGSIQGFLSSTGSAVAAGDPVIEWAEGPPESSEADVLRAEILERQILLAELEGRADDATAATAELAELRDRRAVGEVIVAPVDGVIGRFIAERSKIYDAGDPLFTVGDPSTLRVDIELSGTDGVDDFADVAVGSELRVIGAQTRFAEPTLAVVVAVESVEAAADAPVGTGPGRLVRAELAAGTSLVVGDRVLVDVDRSSGGTSRRVSADAVLDDGRGPFLIVVDTDENGIRWRRLDIEVGISSGDFVEVLADVAVGTVVVVP